MARNDKRSKNVSNNAHTIHTQQESIRLSANEQALFSLMQDLGYSHGLCITALHILSQDRLAVSDMLAFIYEERPSEEDFIKEMARICEANDWESL